ncbi:hypothetical protein NC651_000882 [Populus alba x Populus x berolinensis]|nr:hypothetical protein NC651_000882 [Populus alba x Populus x berolinensis]
METYELSGVHTEGNPSTSIKEPGFGWMTGYLFLVCFVGLFVLIPLRKETSSGIHEVLFNHFLWAFFQWFYTGKEGCGFSQFLLLDFSLILYTTFIGAGMLVSHLVNFSLLLGAVLSYGVMWPLIGQLKGDWFPSFFRRN